MTRIAASYLYPLGSAKPLRNAFIEFTESGRITALGECADPEAEEIFIDGAIVPGFVNAHCHIELSSMKGLFRKGSGMAGFIDQINELRDTVTTEEKKIVIRRWMDELWEKGVSAMADISNGSDSFAIKKASPMYTRTFLEVFGTEPEDCPAVMEGVLSLASEARRLGIDAAPTPHSCYTMSPDLLTASAAEGLKSGFLSFHSEESWEEEEMLRSGSGPMWDNRKAAGMSVPPVTGKSSLLYFLDRLQKAHPAPFEENVLLVHEVCLDQEGIDAAKAVLKHPYFALCPLSNIFIHNALPPVRLMRANGLALTVGTDSLSSNDTLDIVAELYCLQSSFPEVPLEELLTWACLNGAEFLSKDDVLGTLEVGKTPGVVVITDLDGDGRLTPQSCSYRIV